MHNSKLVRLKETLKSVLSQFEAERITSDKGILDVQKAGEKIAVGDTVMGVDAEGVESKVENGEYILTDGTILTITDGRITEIVEPEIEAPAQEEEPVAEEEAPAEEPKEEEVPAEEEAPAEEEEKPAEEEPVEEEPKAEEEEAPAEEEPAKEEEPEVENPTNEAEESDTEAVVALRKEVNELYELVHKLEAEIEKLKNEPAAEPATEEFAKVNKIGKTGNEKLDRLAKLMGA